MLGEYHAVGELVSHSDSWEWFVEVTATFYDDAGSVLGTENAYANPSHIGPGEHAVFRVSSEVGGAAESVASFTVDVTGTLPKSDPANRELEVTVTKEEADESAGVHQLMGL